MKKYWTPVAAAGCSGLIGKTRTSFLQLTGKWKQHSAMEDIF